MVCRVYRGYRVYMVHSQNIILDCGENKYVAECIMKEVNYLKECQRKPLREWTTKKFCEEACDYISVKETNPDPKPWFPKLQWWFNENERKVNDIDYQNIWTPARKNASWLKFQNENLDTTSDRDWETTASDQD